MSALIAAAPNHQARLLILEQWGAGLRLSEALALEPRDLRLDADQPTLRIREGKGENPVKCPCILSCRPPLSLLTATARSGAATWSTFHVRRPDGESSWRQSGRLTRASWTTAGTSALTRCGTATPVTCC